VSLRAELAESTTRAKSYGFAVRGLSENGNPEFATMLKIMKAFGVTMRVA